MDQWPWSFLYTPVREAGFQTRVYTDARGGARRFKCVEAASGVCVFLKESARERESERAGACVAPVCESIGGDDKRAHEAGPHDALTHTTRRDTDNS